MKTTIENQIANSPTVYVIVKYAKWCLQEYKWTGKYKNNSIGEKIPIVWYKYDFNGEWEKWIQAPIDMVTTGVIKTWTFNGEEAQELLKRVRLEDI